MHSLLRYWKSDLPASVVVFFVALPLCLGIALASGAPLIAGIIAGIVGGVIVGALSGSPLGVAGPAAGLAVIVFTAIRELGSFDVFLVAVVLAGVFQVILGYLRAGAIAYYFPSTVITGMLAGIGIIIFLKQIPHALGYDKDPEGDFSFSQLDGETTFSELANALDLFSPGPLLIALLSLAILVWFETPKAKSTRYLAHVPGPLVAVLLTALLGALFGKVPQLALSPEQFVSLPILANAESLQDVFVFPNFSALSQPEVYKVGFVMALVASLETLLCVEAADKLDPAKNITPTNRELKAQGVGNIVSGLLGGLPVTQVIVRSSANIQAGGRSKLSAILHGAFLLLSVLVLPKLLNRIPLSTLAAVLLLVGYKLAKPSLFKRIYREGLPQFIPFLATICGIVFTDLLIGVAIGLAIAIVSLLIENAQLAFRVEESTDEQGMRIRVILAQNVSFLNKAHILRYLNSIPNRTQVEIDARKSVYIHPDVLEIIENYKIGAIGKDITLVVQGLDELERRDIMSLHPPSSTLKIPSPSSSISSSNSPIIQ